MNSELFWETKRPFAEKYGAEFTNFGGSAPADPEALRAEFEANLQAVIDVLHRDQALVDYLADRLVEIGESVPSEIPTLHVWARAATPSRTSGCTTIATIPPDLYAQAGHQGRQPQRRCASGARGSTPLAPRSMAARSLWPASADLAGSTRIAGFAEGYGDFDGYGWYERFGIAGRRAAAPRDHRVRQRRHHGRHGHGQPGRGSRRQRLTGSGARARPMAPSPT